MTALLTIILWALALGTLGCDAVWAWTLHRYNALLREYEAAVDDRAAFLDEVMARLDARERGAV